MVKKAKSPRRAASTRRQSPRQPGRQPPRQPPGAASTGRQPAGAAPDQAPRAAAPLLLTRRQAVGIAVLAVLTLVSLFPALLADFVWDDEAFTHEPLVKSLSGLWGIWFSPGEIKNEGHYWPVVYTSFWLEHKLWGMTPFGFHLVNVLLYLANILLIWLLLWRLAVPGAWAVAAVFAVHPLHVESVAWIIERKDLLSGLFYLGALLSWMHFADSRRWGYYLLSLTLFVAALLSKSIVVTLPVAILIIQWYRHGRINVAELPWLAPFFVVAAGITLADLSFYQSREALSLGYTPVERLLIAGRALCFYVGKLLWPTDLIIIYPLWDIRAHEPLAWLYVIAVLLTAALLWFARGRIGRGPFAGALFFAVTLSPALGFIDYGYMQFSLVADRFQYLAGIGVIAVVVGAAARLASSLSGPLKTGAQGAFIAILVLLGALTWRQAGFYHDEISLFSHITENNPVARDAHLNLSKPLILADRLEEAMRASRIAIEQRPDSEKAHTNMGLALLKLDRYDEAIEYFVKATELNPRHWYAHQNLGETFRKQGRYAESLAAFRAVLEIDDKMAIAHAGVGVALFELHRYEEAIAAISKARALEPTLTPATLHALTGRALAGLARYDEAVRSFESALRADPQNFHAMDHFARLRFNRGEYEKALELYRKMVQREPDNAVAHANMGAALFYLQRNEESRRSFERALALDPTVEAARTGLEHLLARGG